LRCDEARRRLDADAWDAAASRHLETCSRCFDALEAADPVVPALVSARPEAVPAPAGLVDAVLARWRPGRRWPLTGREGALSAGLAAAALLAALLIEVLVGAEPARLAVLTVLGGVVVDLVVSALRVALTARSLLLDMPEVLSLVTLLTLAVCALWVRMAVGGVPTWRSAR
jgi:hypothetical protein